ncbi:hypothetical protein D8674_032689 [Pyrus ussuriensis x Pyrus communis]|uniref:Uncharacterized protein n=1 Tax=Pyrus ussuriensis x Pyrus communis TaxID=2448454 RepID=A0A5N5HWX8_9ROSA|nr:hypothetical protein D8674_032689 [Pyrus ussuriensis x Pyrus communis]
MASAVLHISFPPPPTAHFFPSTPNFLRPITPPITPAQKPELHRSCRRYRIAKIPLSSSFRRGSNSPAEAGCPVPPEQQPINEYQNLSTSFPFSWAAGDLVEYCSRLIATGSSFALLVGLPVASFGALGGPQSDPLRQSLYAVSSGFLVVTLAVVRMYLGWAYVGNRLLSATVEYEETGWYDGQVHNFNLRFYLIVRIHL